MYPGFFRLAIIQLRKEKNDFDNCSWLKSLFHLRYPHKNVKGNEYIVRKLQSIPSDRNASNDVHWITPKKNRNQEKKQWSLRISSATKYPTPDLRQSWKPSGFFLQNKKVVSRITKNHQIDSFLPSFHFAKALRSRSVGDSEPTSTEFSRSCL